MQSATQLSISTQSTEYGVLLTLWCTKFKLETIDGKSILTLNLQLYIHAITLQSFIMNETL